MIERIFILHHTHVDFGYTDPREKVVADLLAMVDQACDLVAQSMDRPEPERFRWIHEVSWPVLEYLRLGGRQAERLFEQMRQGYQELTALYVNPTDLFDKDTYIESIDRACELAARHKLPLTSAMFSDCPGIAWSIPDLLTQRGVKYLSASPDFIMSYPLDVERPFYWEGPKGNRVLTWFSEWRNSWYAEGLFVLKLTEDLDGAPGRLDGYVRQLESEGYRWKGLAIHVAMDNVGPAPSLMDFVAKYNAQNTGRQVQMATNHDFFTFMEKEHRSQFAVHRGAWPDWWSNGNGSAAYETACSRQAKRLLGRAQVLARAAGTTVDAEKLHDAREDILMFDEHTWGHAASVVDPWDALSRTQWTQKRTFGTNAYVKASRLEGTLAGQMVREGQVIVVNPFDHDWTGLVRLKADAKTVKAAWLRDAGGQGDLAGQRHLGADYYQVTVPAGGARKFTLQACDKPHDEGPKALENEQFIVEYDATTGSVKRVFDKLCRCDLVDAKVTWGFGTLIHERVTDGGRKALFDTTKGTTNPESKRPRPSFDRQAGVADAGSIQCVCGPVFNALITAGRVPGARFEREIRLYHGLHRIDVVLRLDKQVDTAYESLYLAFPFAADRPAVWIENAGAVYRPGIDQLPGSATDWHSVGHYAAVSDQAKTVLLVPHDAPLVQVSDIHTGKWAKKLDVANGHLYGWLMNNMWFTNFPAYQEGKVELTWSLTARSGPFEEGQAEAFYQDACLGAAVARANALEQSIVW